MVLAALQDQIANLDDVAATGGERQDATDHILAGISRLTTEVSDASEYAPPRDQMIYTQVRGCAPPTLLGCCGTDTRQIGSQGAERTVEHSNF